MDTTARIVEILEVTDTRSYEEQGDRWVPIPGSGNLNECARCRRMHEVHATVRLSDGAVVIVGTGCMNAESADVASRLKSAASRAKRIASLRAELAKQTALAAEHKRIRAAVDAIPLPPIEETTMARIIGRDAGEERAAYKMGDTSVYDFSPPGTPITRERRESLILSWKHDQARAMGETYYHTIADRCVEDIAARIAKLQAKSN